MTEGFVITVVQNAVYTVLLVSAPMLGLALVIGLAIGIFQAVTSINEMTLTFIPKIVIVLVAVVLFSPWIAKIMTAFTIELFNNIQLIAH